MDKRDFTLYVHQLTQRWTAIYSLQHPSYRPYVMHHPPALHRFSPIKFVCTWWVSIGVRFFSTRNIFQSHSANGLVLNIVARILKIHVKQGISYYPIAGSVLSTGILRPRIAVLAPSPWPCPAETQGSPRAMFLAKSSSSKQ